jgi:hypothetical protein
MNSTAPKVAVTQDGRPVAIQQDALGFMQVKANPAAQGSIELRYTGTTEQRVVAVLSGLAWIAALAALYLRRDRQTAPAARNGSATSYT